MKAMIVKTLAGVALMVAALSVQAALLGELADGGQIQTDDKLATDWDFIYGDPEFAPAIDPGAVEVTAIAAEGGMDNPGFRFDFTGDASPFLIEDLDESALFISFSLDVLDPTKRIVGASLALTGYTAIDESDLGGGFAEVAANIDSVFEPLDPDLEVFSDALFSEEQLFDSVGVGSVQSLDVALLAVLNGISGVYAISQFELRFLQRTIGEVPLPGTLILMLLGLVSIAVGRRRRTV